MPQERIRNFCIIAHIDHGKSTLADRLMEITGTVEKRDLVDQALDSHPISRERGITIKLAPVTMSYQVSGESYSLNLIDTPGHVDFSYEVERSLAASEGAILLVDATQGIQAQTLSNYEKAKRLGLSIIPAVNKIDSPIANVAQAIKDLEETFGFNREEVFQISARTGEGVNELLEAVIKLLPPPRGIADRPLRGLVFSSQFDPKRGVVAFVRIVDGKISAAERTYFLATGKEGATLELGKFRPGMKPVAELSAGEVGYIATNIKEPAGVKVGDTVTVATKEIKSVVVALPGYREPKPMVFVSLFPVDPDEFSELTDALSKLKLSDAALTFSLTHSKALGRGYRCGFLGQLHAEVSQERLESDFGLDIIATTPTVDYQHRDGEMFEPWTKASIIVPQNLVGAVISLCEERRGKLIDTGYHGTGATVVYELPLAEMLSDFFDQLKSVSSGYASLDYEVTSWRPFQAVTLEVLINHEPIDAFSQIMEKTRAEKFGRFLVERLKEIIPRQQIPFPIQAAVDGQIIARADVAAFRKDVTQKLYGGDVTRKMKLLEKQKKGKRKMKTIGKVEIPSDTFLRVFKN